MRALICDTETTGRDPGEVIELAYMDYPPVLEPELKITGRDMAVTGIACFRFKPEAGSTFKAKSVHNIPDAALEGCPPSAAVLDWLLGSGDVDYLIGHNVSYDWEQLGKPETRLICTYRLSKAIWQDDEGHSLLAMVYRLFGDADGVAASKLAHGAAFDVFTCYRVLTAMLVHVEPEQRSLEGLWRICEQLAIPGSIDFGKHKGSTFAQIDQGYMGWYLSQSDTRPEVVAAMRRELARRRAGEPLCSRCSGSGVVTSGVLIGLCPCSGGAV